MVRAQSIEQTEVAFQAEMRARAMLRQALGNTSRGTVRDVFDLAVTRELARMLERGAMATAMAAFQNAAADAHLALASDRAWPSGSIWYAN